MKFVVLVTFIPYELQKWMMQAYFLYLSMQYSAEAQEIFF